MRAAQLLALLADHAVRYVIIGGVAAIVYGAARATFDIDIVPEWTAENLSRLAAALVVAGARFRVPHGDPIAFPIDVDSLRGFEVSTWRTDLGDIDVIVGSPTSRRGVLADFESLVRARRPVMPSG